MPRTTQRGPRPCSRPSSRSNSDEIPYDANTLARTCRPCRPCRPCGRAGEAERRGRHVPEHHLSGLDVDVQQSPLRRPAELSVHRLWRRYPAVLVVPVAELATARRLGLRELSDRRLECRELRNAVPGPVPDPVHVLTRTRSHMTQTRWLVLAALAAPAAPAAAQVKLNGAGATFPNIIYQDWMLTYNKAHSDVQLNYQSIGSGGGIRQFS